MIRTLFFALVTVSTARAQLALWMSPEAKRSGNAHLVEKAQTFRECYQ